MLSALWKLWYCLSYFIGLYYLFKILYKFFMLCLSFVTPLINAPRLRRMFGKDSYVLITGGSDGIGKAYAQFFAKNGFNLILWSRTESKLSALKSSLLKKHPKLDIKTIASDFTFSSESGFFKKVFSQFEDLDISIVVNNVGFIRRFDDLGMYTAKVLVKSININTIPQAVICGHFLNKFKKREKSLTSAFIDLSSIGAELPMVKRHIYTATKSFNYYFTRAMSNATSRGMNVFCQSVLPSLVQTNMAEDFKRTFEKGKMDQEFTLSTMAHPSETVEGSIRGLAFGLTVVSGSFVHSVLRIVFFALNDITWFLFDLKAAFRQMRS